jgi:transcriptional regulator with XRE-family HTH domain
MYIASNIKFLRKRRRLTQSGLAETLNIKRSNINNYERGEVVPPVNILVELSDLFHVSLDTLLRVDLSGLRESQLYMIEHGADVFVKGNDLRVLVTTVNAENKENIELVSIKAKAGYTTGYFDPEYISQLPVFNLPFLAGDKKYRTFQVSGDSMLPISNGNWVTGEFVQDLNLMKDDELYIVLTLNEGIVFKKVKNLLKEKGCLRMISLNPEYLPYDLPVTEIREVWRFVHYISGEVPEYSDTQQLYRQIELIRGELETIRGKIG